ncbi:MAG: uroporphyrinogen-III C-methyltransferase [Flavobacteriales bacterium]|nr:MAG: uroporphyrinogen-III C-methyltransferase [Flavobacteriales bacterium]
MNTSKLTLVGAGPGDPDLISVKGVKAIGAADVILYDALVDDDLLVYAKPSAKKIFVGKRAGKHSRSQTEINMLIVQYAFSHGHVVRIKGGDPFIFGRGHEEMEYAEAFGIEVKVVPGISSSTALPALQGIPLTKRGLNESFWVITGTTRSGELSKDIELAAQSTATIVILMGMRKLREIVSVFTGYDRSETPVVVIQNGSTSKEKIAIGTVDTIVEIAKKKKLSSPAIIVIGDVVGVHKQFNYEQLKTVLA